MPSKPYPTVQHLDLGEGMPYPGFLLAIDVPGWHLLHFWSGELVLNGYMLMPHDEVKDIRPEKRTGVYHRLQRAAGIAPEDPVLTGSSVRELLHSISLKWPLVIIYRKKYGLSELDVGRIERIEDDRFHYLEVAPNGDVLEPLTVAYDEILFLAFGDSYTEMLGKIIAHREGKKPA